MHPSNTSPPATENRLQEISERWPEISALLDVALALTPAQRAPWLASLSQENPALAAVVGSLLSTHDQLATDFLDEVPPLESAAPPSHGPVAGDRVGPFELLRELGRGGMGSVWLARRAEGVGHRQVALKLPRIAWGDAFTERLAREREILATFSHPNIARLYEAGVDSHGRPWLAMEYVDGEPIDQYCQRQGLSLGERVNLLAQVMGAVAHAHAHLVVHRDLKPGNILVDRDGRPRLLDFGVAKLLDGDRTRDTALTELSGNALTADYASPEQVRGEPLGTASDVYSMGVVAYELLAGARPYRLRQRSRYELESAIASAEVALASSRAVQPADAKALRGDLDSVLNKALRKDTATRYPTMDAFAQDLQRWTRREPVQAQPDTWAYRGARFLARHRLPVAAATVAVVALLGGTSAALWQAREARIQAAHAVSESATANAVQAFLESVFRANGSKQVAPEQARQATARELLDRGAERIDRELATAPRARLTLLNTLAAMYEDMALFDRHIELRRRALALARELDGPDSQEALLASVGLAHALTMSEKLDEATAVLDDTRARLDRLGDQTSHAREQLEVAQASLLRRHFPERGLQVADRAVALARASGNVDDLLFALMMQGDNAYFSGHNERAVESYTAFLDLASRNGTHGADNIGTVRSELGAVLNALGRYQEGEAQMRQAVQFLRERGEPNQFHDAQVALASLLASTGRPREAVAELEPSAAWMRGDPPDAYKRYSRRNYVHVLQAYGRAADAVAESDDDPALTMPLSRATQWDILALVFRGAAQMDLGRLAQADATIARARSAVLAGGVDLSEIVSTLGSRLAVARGRAPDALRMFQDYRVKAGKPALPDPLTSTDLPDLVEGAWLAAHAGEGATGERLARRALALISSGRAPEVQRHREAQAIMALGESLAQQQRWAEACPTLARALAAQTALYDPASARIAEAAHALGQANCARRSL